MSILEYSFEFCCFCFLFISAQFKELFQSLTVIKCVQHMCIQSVCQGKVCESGEHFMQDQAWV